MSDTTVTTDPPMPNSPEARTPTGELKDASTTTTTSTETTPETKPEATSTESKKDEVPSGAPEKYEDFKLPDGVKLEPESLKSATDLFKSLNLPQAAAQSLVDFHTAQLKAVADAPSKAYDDMRADWQAKAKADPEIGPHMTKIKENVGRLYNAIGDAKLVDDFKQIMDLTGAGDNPAFIKVLNKLSSFVTEGTHVAGAQPSKFGQQEPGKSERPTAAQALYPNNP
jgi:hypothetical protein